MITPILMPMRAIIQYRQSSALYEKLFRKGRAEWYFSVGWIASVGWVGFVTDQELIEATSLGAEECIIEKPHLLKISYPL